VLALGAFLLAPAALRADDTIHPGQPGNDRLREAAGTAGGAGPGEAEDLLHVHYGLVLQSLFFFQSDTDFDSTAPLYDVEGQTSGFCATVFQPGVAFDVDETVRVYYEAELGLNLWSRNNPDENSALADDVFLLKHREVWAETYFLEGFGAKVGYQRVIDPTGLFVNHWIGAGALFLETEAATYTLLAGQLPDSTHEGLTFEENNFVHDAFLAGLRGDFRFGPTLQLDAATLAFVDASVAGRTNWVFAPTLSLKVTLDEAAFSLDALLQAGRQEHVKVDGGDQTNVGWAVQGHAEFERDGWFLGGNALLLGADNGAEYDDWNLAPYASGKNRSFTLLLTEDELRDRYANFDERMAALGNGFYLMRSGMALFDVLLRRTLFDGLFTPGLVAGTFVVLNPGNAMGHAWGGFEADLLADFDFSRWVRLRLAGGLLVPGAALAVHVNAIDAEATEPLGMFEAVLEVRI
jgi:hypothetical protein